ncbi:MAG: VCBS repeat-containing protein, partial [Dysgonamonadaceae bacterium]|nr:VCBS repeat-containing protein [Dysgonamonadaceae bacterium]
MKQRTTKNFKQCGSLLLLLLALMTGANLQAQQSMVQAVPQNVFTKPGTQIVIDVLGPSALGYCDEMDIALEILPTQGTLLHGTASVSYALATYKKIIYTPTAGYTGQDQFQFQITCGRKTSYSTIVINIDDKPDNIVTDLCAIPPTATVWSIKESPLNLGATVNNYCPFVVGDIDGDGVIEIIGLGTRSIPATDGVSFPNDTIKIFYWNKTNNRVELKRKFALDTPGGARVSEDGVLAMARYNGQSYIICLGVDSYLYAYNANGTRLWKSDITVTYLGNHKSTIFNIADFNNDGIPEVYAGNQIFSITNGKLLCSGGTNNHGALHVQGGSATIAADMDDDGKLELVAGTQIYRVNITNNNGTAGNSMTVITDMSLADAKLPANALKDGATQVIDIDNDGKLEVVVISRNATNSLSVCYVWKPLSGNQSYLMGRYQLPETINFFSIPMIGNIDDDPQPEIVFISAGTANNRLMYALKFDPTKAQGSQLVLKWTLPHTDNSGETGASLFDFNQDGQNEIVYRDETMLRIIDGSGTSANVLATFNNITSGTLKEIPVIADIDGDGQAEIIINGYTAVTVPYARNGYVRVLKSNGSPWAPARTVWNQYSYNPVYVNEDLTIPAYPINPATKFTDEKGVVTQPYNNFLQQATLLKPTGDLFTPGPDLAFDKTYIPTYTSTNITFRIENLGDAVFKGPLTISVYQAQAGSYAFVEKRTFAGDIAVGAAQV